MAKSNIELIKEFIATCPLLSGGKINLDYIEDEIDSYSINKTPSNPVLKSYTDGGNLMQITFDFVVTAPYSKIENLTNSRFFEDFSNWIREQDRKGDLPNIEGIISIECLSNGTIEQVTDTTAIYNIQIRILYED